MIFLIELCYFVFANNMAADQYGRKSNIISNEIIWIQIISFIIFVSSFNVNILLILNRFVFEGIEYIKIN